MPDVIVVGGGIIGVATAAFCAQNGLSVTLLEREGLAAAASGRNQGLVIGPHPPEMAPLAARGLQHYLDVHDESGRVFAFDRDPHGCLLVGADPHGPGRPLAGPELRAVEPQLAAEVTEAVLMEDARRVDPAAAVAAWAVRARRLGADLRTGVDVKELVYAPGGGRVVGVLSDEGRLLGGTVVVAAGPWSWRVCRSGPFDVPVRGVRGWLVITRPAPFRLRHAIEESFWGAAKSALAVPTVGGLAGAAGGAGPNGPGATFGPPPLVAGLVQQDHQGRLLLGASLQVNPTDHPSGEEAVALVAARAARLVPACAGLEVAEVRTCRRPMSPDGLPLHGPVPGVEGLILACGHGSQGVTWGPGSGEAVVAGIVSGDWPAALQPARFAAPSVGPGEAG